MVFQAAAFDWGIRTGMFTKETVTPELQSKALAELVVGKPGATAYGECLGSGGPMFFNENQERGSLFTLTNVRIRASDGEPEFVALGKFAVDGSFKKCEHPDPEDPTSMIPCEQELSSSPLWGSKAATGWANKPLGMPIPCSAGSFLKDGACNPAELGYFVLEAAQTEQSKCLPGSFSNTTGSVSCIACPVGYSQSEAGQTACSPCPIGHFGSAPNIATCSPCPKGAFVEVAGAGDCRLCATGTFNDAQGQATCKTCLGETEDVFPSTTSRGTRSLAECGCPAESFYSLKVNACLQCPKGMNCPFGSRVDNILGLAAGPAASPGSSRSDTMHVLGGFYLKDATEIPCSGSGCPKSQTLDVFGCSSDEICPASLQAKACRDGHDPASYACGSCLPDYGEAHGGTCEKCENTGFAVFIGIFVIFFAPVVLCMLLNDPFAGGAKRATIQGAFTPVMAIMQQFAFLFVIGQLVAVVGGLHWAVPQYVRDMFGWLDFFMIDLRLFRFSCVWGTKRCVFLESPNNPHLAVPHLIHCHHLIPILYIY